MRTRVWHTAVHTVWSGVCIMASECDFLISMAQSKQGPPAEAPAYLINVFVFLRRATSHLPHRNLSPKPTLNKTCGGAQTGCEHNRKAKTKEACSSKAYQLNTAVRRARQSVGDHAQKRGFHRPDATCGQGNANIPLWRSRFLEAYAVKNGRAVC